MNSQTNIHKVEGVECLNQEGKPDLAIPLPYVSGLWVFTRFKCVCGKKFTSEKNYHVHYRLENESEWFLES